MCKIWQLYRLKAGGKLAAANVGLLARPVVRRGGKKEKRLLPGPGDPFFGMVKKS